MICLRIVVQKFGGSSMAGKEPRSCVVKHVRSELDRGSRLIIVVSAMGRKGDPYATDTLLDFIQENGGELPPRETDLLLSCGEIISAATLCSLLHAEGIASTVLTGAQAGILTNNVYGDARIISIDPQLLLERLESYPAVIVAGFQGMNRQGDITTLGRGGSDTTAAALAVSVNAERVDIFTDVDGVLTADPKIVKEAKPLDRISYAEICNMAYQGAKVIHPRAVEIAMQAGIPMRIRSTFSTGPGTLVASQERLRKDGAVQDKYVTGIAQVPHVSQIQITSAQGQYDLQLQIFKAMAMHRISVDFINVAPSGVTYTVFDHEVDKAEQILQELGYAPVITKGCAKVAVIGGGMNGVPGIMAKVVESLMENNIRILQTADSNNTIWVLVDGENMASAVRALHQKFLTNDTLEGI